MQRRQFLQAGGASLALAASGFTEEFADRKPRVGLIGCGWYGKCDLFRLLQVVPETRVVGLCDVDKAMLADAAKMVGERSRGKSTPKTYPDYRQMLKDEQFD